MTDIKDLPLWLQNQINSSPQVNSQLLRAMVWELRRRTTSRLDEQQNPYDIDSQPRQQPLRDKTGSLRRRYLMSVLTRAQLAEFYITDDTTMGYSEALAASVRVHPRGLRDMSNLLRVRHTQLTDIIKFINYVKRDDSTLTVADRDFLQNITVQ